MATLTTLIEVVDKRYGDGLVLRAHRLPKQDVGDSLATFIARELSSTFSENSDVETQFRDAREALLKAQDQLLGCVDALEEWYEKQG